MHQSSLASMGSLTFNRFIGSLGTPLPAPNLFSEPTGVDEHDEQSEGRGSSGSEAAPALQVDSESD